MTACRLKVTFMDEDVGKPPRFAHLEAYAARFVRYQGTFKPNG